MTFTPNLRCAAPADWVPYVSQCLYEWQSLVAAAVAVCGAILVWNQIKQAGEQYRDELQRKHKSARLTLPLTLASVSNLVREAVSRVASKLGQFGDDGFDYTIDAILGGNALEMRFEPLWLDEAAISAFRQLVESLDRHEDVRHVAELVASLQIFLSRYNDLNLQSAGVKMSLEGLLIDAAKVQMLTDAIYNYARFVDDAPFGIMGVKPTADVWDDIHGKAQALLFQQRQPDQFFAALQQRIDRYKEGNANPWLAKFEA